MGITFWNLLLILSALILLTFFVRFSFVVCMPGYLDKVRRRPVIHAVWGLLTLMSSVYIYFWFVHPFFWWVIATRHEQHQEVLERVKQAGGWDAVRTACDQLVSNNPDGLEWFPPSSNAMVFPDPGTNPGKYYVTNIDYGQMPSAISNLHPTEVRFYSLEELGLSSRNRAHIIVARIELFGGKRTGLPSNPYYRIEVPCGSGADDFDPRTNSPYSKTYHKVANRVYEVRN